MGKYAKIQCPKAILVAFGHPLPIKSGSTFIREGVLIRINTVFEGIEGYPVISRQIIQDFA